MGTRCTGVRGFAGLVLSAASDTGTKTEHIGIVDPRIAPSEGHDEVWEHFGITSDAIVAAVKSLANQNKLYFAPAWPLGQAGVF